MLDRKFVFIALALVASSFSQGARAWGAAGHHTVGALASGLMAGSTAAKQVDSLLGGISLEDAAVWADCAKGIDPAKGYAYTSAGRYPECAVLETPERIAEMADFVRRNDTQCGAKPGEESCHKQYHYTDAAIQRDLYALGSAGTRADDVVAATAAAIAVLLGHPSPPPFDIKGPREALLLLAHYVGDLHQPLHVGAIYLGAQGQRVDPDAGADAGRLDPATDTRGGNQIIVTEATPTERAVNLHRVWDDVAPSQRPAGIDAAWLAEARAVPNTTGPIDGWPAQWATQSLQQAQRAFEGMGFGPKQGAEWKGALPAAYADTMLALKKTQLTDGGARLAQILLAVWP